MRQAWDAADPSRDASRLLELFREPVDRISYISKVLSDPSTESPNSWWVREKLSTWLVHLSAAEISIGSVITLLDSWASFDPPKDSQNDF
jgi:hypothetical protein